MWSLYYDRQTLPGEESPSPKTSSLPAQCQLCASPALAPLTADSISFTPPLPQTHRIQWGSVWVTSTLTILSVSITFNVDGRAVQVDVLHSQIELLTFFIFFSPNKLNFLSSKITLSLGAVPDMGRQARSNPSPLSPAGTNPSDKGVWERETFSCWMHNLSSVYSPVHLHHRQ